MNSWSGQGQRRNPIERVGAVCLATTEALGADATLFIRSVAALTGVFRKTGEIFRQMYICGVLSFPVVVLVSIFAGAVLSLQGGLTLQAYGAESKIGAIVAASMCREMGPIMTALILAGRVGSAMAAELGTMRASEEIDALEAMSIDPVRFLVMPRLVAMAVMAPVLTVFSDIIGIIGGAVVGATQIGVSATAYFDEARATLIPLDLNSGLVKAFVFGVVITIVGCSRGLRAQSSAEGVGKATKDSVVASFILIIILNYVITSVVQPMYPN
jgi:phospholipid/cholesterol/gamma-HCH transport system permease protein